MVRLTRTMCEEWSASSLNKPQCELMTFLAQKHNKSKHTQSEIQVKKLLQEQASQSKTSWTSETPWQLLQTKEPSQSRQCAQSHVKLPIGEVGLKELWSILSKETSSTSSLSWWALSPDSLLNLLKDLNCKIMLLQISTTLQDLCVLTENKGSTPCRTWVRYDHLREILKTIRWRALMCLS